MSAELDEKTERLCRVAVEQGINGILINAQPNFAWLTCGGTNGVDQSRENGVASLLVTRDGRRFVMASRIEMPRMLAEEITGEDFEPVQFAWQDDKADPRLLTHLSEQIAGGKVAKDTEIDVDVSRCRYSLTVDERERYRKLGQDASECMRRVSAIITPGQTEIAIAETLRHELGNVCIASVVTLVAADDRISKFRHPVPTSKRWERSLLLVTCARREGLIVNLSRMIRVGSIDEQLAQKTEDAAFVSASLMHATRVEMTGSDLYGIAARGCETRGYASEIDLHHQGGATGYRTRDWVAHPASCETVQPWQPFAWNPSITGTKIEDTMLVGDGGAEMITRIDGWPELVTTIDGEKYTAAGILTV